MVTYPKLSLIVARSRNGVIGVDGDLPWRLPSDLKHFKQTTLGKPVLMGRVTWESLPFPLPGRPNLVLTRNDTYKAKKAEVFTDLHEMVGRGFELAGLMGEAEVMLIGGAKLYTALLPFCDRCYVTEVDTMIEGDAHFPALSEFDWQQVSEQPLQKAPKDDFKARVIIYDRR
ncbi:MAG: dihydrofolate reductase [Maricaulaceae bacterium]